MRSLLLTLLVVVVFGAVHGCQLNTGFRPKPPNVTNCIIICVNLTNNLTAEQLENARNAAPGSDGPRYKLRFRIHNKAQCFWTTIVITVNYFTPSQCFKLKVNFAGKVNVNVKVKCQQLCKRDRKSRFEVTNEEKVEAMAIPEAPQTDLVCDAGAPACPSLSTVSAVTQTSDGAGNFTSVGSTNVTTVTGEYEAAVSCRFSIKDKDKDSSQKTQESWTVAANCTETRYNLGLSLDDQLKNQTVYEAWCNMKPKISTHDKVKP